MEVASHIRWHSIKYSPTGTCLTTFSLRSLSPPRGISLRKSIVVATDILLYVQKQLSLYSSPCRPLCLDLGSCSSGAISYSSPSPSPCKRGSSSTIAPTTILCSSQAWWHSLRSATPSFALPTSRSMISRRIRKRWSGVGSRKSWAGDVGHGHSVTWPYAHSHAASIHHHPYSPGLRLVGPRLAHQLPR